MTRQQVTVSELARRAGKYRPHTSAYLSGRADMVGETLDLFLEALDLEVRPKRKKR